MRPVLRRFLVVGAVIASVAVLGVSWIATAFLFSPCQYELTHERVSPSARYVAEIYGANCGMGGSRDVVMLRDRSAIALRGVDGMPAGTLVANDFTPARRGEDIFWDGETMLVLQYAAAAPEIVRAEWGGVRIVTRRVS